MRTLHRIVCAAALALAPVAAAHAPADAQAAVARWRGAGNEQLIDHAVRRYGFAPHRLTNAQVRAIDDAWTDLLGPGRRVALNRAQATAIVYMALVEPHEDRRRRDDEFDRRPGAWGPECERMEADAYRLGTLVGAPSRNAGLFVQEPEKSRARALARQIQERAVQCRATAAAGRAGEVMALLADGRPRRTTVEQRVDALKRALRDAAPGYGRR